MLSQGDLGSSFAGVMLVAAGIVLVFSLGRLLRKRGSAPPPPEAVERAVRRVEEAAEKAVSDIESLGGELQGRIETRIRVLAELLARADAFPEGPNPPAQSKEAGPARPDRTGERGSKLEEVFELAGRGMDASGIAELTSLEPAEVEFILSLREMRRSRRL